MLKYAKHKVRQLKGAASMVGWRVCADRLRTRPRLQGEVDFGAFVYETTNIGDEVQTIAALSLLPQGAAVVPVNRDALSLFKGRPGRRTLVLFNGWHTHAPGEWPPASSIVPALEGFHLATDSLLHSEKTVDYLKRFGPVGCRDSHTVSVMRSYGVDAFFSGCPTLMLEGFARETLKREEILVIDAHLRSTVDWHIGDTRTHLASIVPREILEQAVYLTQNVEASDKRHHRWKLSRAHERLLRLASAKLVITNRLHVALPCLAFGTPCILMHENARNDPRLRDYVQWLHFSSTAEPLEGFNWFQPVAKPIPDWVAPQRSRILERLTKLCSLSVDFAGGLS